MKSVIDLPFKSFLSMYLKKKKTKTCFFVPISSLAYMSEEYLCSLDICAILCLLSVNNLYKRLAFSLSVSNLSYYLCMKLILICRSVKS